jgi:hypothetical protein
VCFSLVFMLDTILFLFSMRCEQRKLTHQHSVNKNQLETKWFKQAAPECNFDY